MKNGFIWRNQGIPVFDDKFLPVDGAVAIFSDVLVKEMGVGNDPSILGDVENVVGIHPLIIVPDCQQFYLIQELGATN